MNSSGLGGSLALDLGKWKFYLGQFFFLKNTGTNFKVLHTAINMQKVRSSRSLFEREMLTGPFLFDRTVLVYS